LKFHMPLLEAVKAHRPDYGCLTSWTWMPSLEHVCFGSLPKLLKIADPYKGHHPRARKTRLLAPLSLIFYEEQIHFVPPPSYWLKI
jgi:hypothetical protein